MYHSETHIFASEDGKPSKKRNGKQTVWKIGDGTLTHVITDIFNSDIKGLDVVPKTPSGHAKLQISVWIMSNFQTKCT